MARIRKHKPKPEVAAPHKRVSKNKIVSIEASARRYSERAMGILQKAMDRVLDDEWVFNQEEMKMAIVASKEILDRGFGRARQQASITVDHTVNGVAIALEQARQRAIQNKPPLEAITVEYSEVVVDDPSDSEEPNN